MKSRKIEEPGGEYSVILGHPVAEFSDLVYQAGSGKSDNGSYYQRDEGGSQKKGRKRIIVPVLSPGTVAYKGDSHLMTVAPTGSGKGRSVIIPNLLHYKGSVIVVDPKGENYAVTADWRRKMGQKVIVLDPFRVSGEHSDGLNPLDIFSLPNANIESDAQMIAELLAEGNKFAKDPFWDLSAGGLISGILAYIASVLEKEDWSFNKLKDILMGDDVVYNLAVILDSNGKKMSKMAHQELAAFLQMPEKETRPSVLATALTYLKAFTSEQVASTLAKSSFDLREVVEGDPLSIYIIVPPDKLKSHRAILKLWIGTLMKAITSRKEIPDRRTLFILDECAQLGNFPFLDTAISLLRGYGLQTWTFWQDLAQLRKNYEIEWPTMVNNCAVVQVFGTKNNNVASEFAKLVGVDVEQVNELHPSDQILMVNGRDLLKAKRLDYLNDEKFKGKFQPNPFFTRKSSRE